MAAILAAYRPLTTAKVYAATNTYEWTKQVDQDLLGGSYTSVASSADGRNLLVGSTFGGEGSAQASPLFRSNNYGLTWQNVTENADPGIRNYWVSVDVSNDGQTMIAASDRSVASTEVYGNDPGKLFISHDSGATWENISPDTTEDWVSVAISGDASKIVAVANDDTQNVYVSDNSGDTWQSSPINEDLWHWESISISDDGDKVLIGGENNSNAGALVEISADGGDTWSNISPNPTDYSFILRTAMSASGDKIVIANQGYNTDYYDAIHESNDDGANWNDITPVDAEINAWSAIALSGDSSKLVVSDESNKMYISSDAGANWTEEAPGQAYEDSNSWRSVDLSDDGSFAIAASSSNAYVTKYTPPNPTVTFDDAENGNTVTLTTPSGTTITCHSSVKESNLANKDAAYSYPNGLVDFCFSGADLSNEITLLFVTDLKPNQVAVRKYNPGTGKYSTVSEAVITEATLGGKHALQITYTIVDNGPLDTDPDVGEVADPVGIGVIDVGVPNTGIGTVESEDKASFAATLAVSTITAALLLSPIRKKAFNRSRKTSSK
jgi:photosystem II stability/assembly factor-like uncharacterized protein